MQKKSGRKILKVCFLKLNYFSIRAENFVCTLKTLKFITCSSLDSEQRCFSHLSVMPHSMVAWTCVYRINATVLQWNTGPEIPLIHYTFDFGLSFGYTFRIFKTVAILCVGMCNVGPETYKTGIKRSNCS